jgi:two-component system sensor histidine kinase AlgZ
MASIKQNLAGQPLPDFRNAGVMLRILLGVNLLALARRLVQSEGVSDSVQHVTLTWLPGCSPCCSSTCPAGAAREQLAALLPSGSGGAGGACWPPASAMLLTDLWRFLTFDEGGWQRLLRAGLLGWAGGGVHAVLLALRASALSPALVEARLQSLTARIRPHFLFNSLNAVISLIRLDPRRAETALEEVGRSFSRADARSSRTGPAGRRDRLVSAVSRPRKAASWRASERRMGHDDLPPTSRCRR